MGSFSPTQHQPQPRTLAWAAGHGTTEVSTWTQRGNHDMRALSTRLGYVTRSESITMRAALPLPSDRPAAELAHWAKFAVSLRSGRPAGRIEGGSSIVAVGLWGDPAWIPLL